MTKFSAIHYQMTKTFDLSILITIELSGEPLWRPSAEADAREIWIGTSGKFSRHFADSVLMVRSPSGTLASSVAEAWIAEFYKCTSGCPEKVSLSAMIYSNRVVLLLYNACLQTL